MSGTLRYARGYDRWMRKRGPLAAAMRFAMSVPGQILVNTAAFTLPQELRMTPQLQVLDLGCGRAGVARVVAERARLETAPVALDASAVMLELARRDSAREGGAGPRLVRGTGPALPFRDAAFDLVLSGHTLKYFTDPELRATLSEVRRVLKEGGLLVAWEFAPTGSRALDAWNRRVLTLEVPFERLRSHRELVRLGHEAGFEWIAPARLRPFLLPPIPRVSLVMGKAPAGWRPEG